MTQDINNPTHYTADERKTFMRIEDGFIMGNDMYIGKYIDGTDDVIGNYVEIDDPNPKSEQISNMMNKQ